MGYYIDFENISIESYRDELKTASLTKSRLTLKENTNEIFGKIKKQNINTVNDLQKALKTKEKLKAFSEKSGIDEEYLTILIREINSNQQKPNKIKDFPNIPGEIIEKLERLGIKDTFQLFQRVIDDDARKSFCKESGIDKEGILKLAKLADLSRIRWVNHTFAYVLYEIGYDTVEKVINADYEQLHKKVNQLNQEQTIYKGHIGVNDMKLTIEAAKKVSLDIEY
ncbi:MAG: DUF4332 domain-containing protein [Chloroflexia bacterium]|nr:DUF4332 domain-containing protein [Chloroflexia bacterium]